MVTRQELPEKWNLCNNKSILGNGMKSFSIRTHSSCSRIRQKLLEKKKKLAYLWRQACPYSKYSAFFFYFHRCISTIISEYFYFRYLHDNALGCECTTVNSLYGVQKVLSTNTQCSSPNALIGVLFASAQSTNPNHFSKMKKSLFQCSKSIK